MLLFGIITTMPGWRPFLMFVRMFVCSSFITDDLTTRCFIPYDTILHDAVPRYFNMVMDFTDEFNVTHSSCGVGTQVSAGLIDLNRTGPVLRFR